MSALDKLVSQDDDDDDYDDSDGDSDDNNDEEDAEDRSDEIVGLYEMRGPDSPFYEYDGKYKDESTEEEWADIINEYRRAPTTEVER